MLGQPRQCNCVAICTIVSALQVRNEKPQWTRKQELNLMLKVKNKLDTELYEFAKQEFTHYASDKK